MAFFELNIAMSGLFAAQRGLQVTSNNITNATTEGYSRQVLSQKADSPLSGLGVGMTGTGVETTGINRVRNSYLDNKIWNQNAKLGQFNIKVTQNSLIEGVFGEPSDVGYTKVFDNLFSSLSSLSNNPTSSDGKTAVKENLISFTQYYNEIVSSLKSYQKDLNLEVKAAVEEINALGERIQSLNKQIFEAEIYGDEASSFRDERDLCIDRLSELIDTKVTETEVEVQGNTVKRFSVSIAGKTFVDHYNLNTLELEVRGETEAQINTIVEKLNEQYALLKVYPTDTTIQDQIKNLQAELGQIKGVTVAADGTVTYTNKDNITTTALTVDAAHNTHVTRLTSGIGNEVDVDGLYDIKWSNGLTFDITSETLSGELKGLIDMRDGCGTGAAVTYKGMPYYMERMDNYVRHFAKTMNEQYSSDENGHILIQEITASTGEVITALSYDDAGNYTFYDEDGNEVAVSVAEAEQIANSYTTKYKLFSCSTGDTKGTPTDGSELVGDYSAMTATNFSISLELFEDPTNMRTAYKEDEPSDTSFLLELIAQKNNQSMFKEGSPTDYMIGMLTELGINVSAGEMYQQTQESVVTSLENQRLSISQVDTNEEFAYLIKYQQAYQAAAKLVTVIDEIYQTTIFKMGNF